MATPNPQNKLASIMTNSLSKTKKTSNSPSESTSARSKKKRVAQRRPLKKSEAQLRAEFEARAADPLINKKKFKQAAKQMLNQARSELETSRAIAAAKAAAKKEGEKRRLRVHQAEERKFQRLREENRQKNMEELNRMEELREELIKDPGNTEIKAEMERILTESRERNMSIMEMDQERGKVKSLNPISQGRRSKSSKLSKRGNNGSTDKFIDTRKLQRVIKKHNMIAHGKNRKKSSKKK